MCGRAQAGSALSAGSSTPTSASLFLSRGGKGGGQKRRSIRQNQPPWGPSHSQGCGFAYELYGVVFDMFRTCCSNLLFLPWRRSLALWLDLVLASFSPLLLSSLPEREISLSRERQIYINCERGRERERERERTKKREREREIEREREREREKDRERER